MFDMDALVRAVNKNDGDTVDRLLAQHPRPHELYANHLELRMDRLAAANRDKVIPVIARYVPQAVHDVGADGYTPFLCAAEHYRTESMLALAHLGADVHVRVNPSYPDSDGAMKLACLGLYIKNSPAPIDHLIAMRSLGLCFDEPPGAAAIKLFDAANSSMLMRMLDAGAPLYQALHMPVPADPLHPDFAAIDDIFNAQHTGDPTFRVQVASVLRDYIRDVLETAPKQDARLYPTLFMRSDNTVHKAVYRWEALSLLPVYFSRDAAEHWEGGMTEMLETAHRLPAYLQESINLPGLLRDIPTPRENSVTISYTRGNTPELRL